MNFLKLFLFLTVFFFCHAFAEEETSRLTANSPTEAAGLPAKSPTETEGLPANSPIETQVESDTSESLRVKNPFYVAGSAALWSDTFPAAGAKIGWRNAKWGLEAVYSQNADLQVKYGFLILYSEPIEESTLRNVSFSLDGKRFFSNSFYTGTGLSYQHRTSEHSSKIYTIDPNCSLFDNRCETMVGKWEQVGTETVDMLTGHLFIGNQVDFSFLTIGCDWFGISFPLVTLSRKTSGRRAPNNGLSFDSDFPLELYIARLYAGITF